MAEVVVKIVVVEIVEVVEVEVVEEVVVNVGEVVVVLHVYTYVCTATTG